MALTGTDRGSGARNTAGESTYAVSPNGTIPAGALVVANFAYDNSGTNGADPFSAMSDSVGNDWFYGWTNLNDPGAANAGIVIRSMYGYVKTPITASDTITISLGGITTVARAYTLHQIVSDRGLPQHKEVINNRGTSGTGTAVSVSLNEDMPSGGILIGAMGLEGVGAVTADSDSTNGSWSTQQTATVGTTTSGVRISSQRKLLTADSAIGAFAFDQTITSSDWGAHMIYIIEVPIVHRSPFTTIQSQ